MHGAVKETTGDFLNLSDFPRDQYPKHYTTAHSQNYVNQSINQSIKKLSTDTYQGYLV